MVLLELKLKEDIKYSWRIINNELFNNSLQGIYECDDVSLMKYLYQTGAKQSVCDKRLEYFKYFVNSFLDVWNIFVLFCLP